MRRYAAEKERRWQCSAKEGTGQFITPRRIWQVSLTDGECRMVCISTVKSGAGGENGKHRGLRGYHDAVGNAWNHLDLSKLSDKRTKKN